MPYVHVQRQTGPLDALSEQLRLLWDVEAHVQSSHHETNGPQLNVLENKTDFFLTVELPGVSADDVELTATEETLTLACRRDDDVDDADAQETYRRRERWRGRWRRDVAFPRRVQPDGVSARLDDGVLTVRIPKSADAKPRRIEVSSAARVPRDLFDPANEGDGE
ncbi:MAG: Hsp20/alpha crystallin family protein [Planctomycetia bacterium]